MMIKKFRNKFIIVTVIMFAVCFALIITENTLFNKLAYYQDTYQELLWLADNEPFEHYADDMTDKVAFDMVYYGYNPIYCLTTDADGNILDTHIIGGDNPPELPKAVVNTIITADEDVWKYKSYVFCHKKIDSDTLILINDCHSQYDTTRLINLIVLSILGLILIGIIALLLSRFVTKPAKDALLREKQLTAEAGHELKTPISAIKVNLDGLSQAGISSPLLDNAKNETDKMSKLIQEMLTLSRTERNQGGEGFAEFSLSKCAERMALTYESIAFSKGLYFNYSIENNITYRGVESEIENLLGILLDNAIKYNVTGGEIKFKLGRVGHNFEIIISDTGIGISPEDSTHIFDRFYVADSSRSDNSFGLGLSIAKAIVSRHSGRITVDSQKGIGSTFRIVL